MGCQMSQNKSSTNRVQYNNAALVEGIEHMTGAWKVQDSLTLHSWMESEAAKWGFPVDIDYVSRQIRIQPWATRGRHFETLLPAPINTDDLDVKYSYKEILIEETGLWKAYRLRSLPCYKGLVLKKYKYSPFLDVAQVIGSCDDIVVIQMVLQEVNQFLVVDLSSEQITGYFEKKHWNKHCLYECSISPDYSTFVLKPSALFQKKFKISTNEDEALVYSTQNFEIQGQDRINNVSKLQNQMSNVSVQDPDLVNISLCEAEDNVKVTIRNATYIQDCGTIFPGQAKESVVAFDPRYKNSRLAVVSYSSRKELCIGMYCLVSGQYLHQSRAGQGAPRYLNLVFSPCGSYIAATNITYSPDNNTFPKKFNFLGVHLYRSDDLSLLQRLDGTGYTSLSTLVPQALFPQFSSCGKYLAVGSCKSSEHSEIGVYQVAPVLNLQHQCRLVILDMLVTSEIYGQQYIDILPIPDMLKDFIKFKPTK